MKYYSTNGNAPIANLQKAADLGDESSKELLKTINE